MSQIFALVATGALMSVYQMTKSKNPVHSVFYLVLLFLHCSGLLVLLGLEYFVLLQLQVYVGALAILFLFVVMLLDIPSTEILAHQRGTYPVAGVLFLCIAICAFQAQWQPFSENIYTEQPSPAPQQEYFTNSSLVFSGVARQQENAQFSQRGLGRQSSESWQNIRKNTSPVANQGIAQYGVHPDQQILASLLLLVAMVGAVGLTLKRPVAAPDYDVFAQHYVDFQKGLLQIRGADKNKSIFIFFFYEN